jgi:predicted dehydrogenase
VELNKPGEFERFVTKPGRYAGWYEWEAFQRAVRGEGGVPQQNPEAVLYGLRLLAAVRRSAESGQVERV